MNGKLLTFYIAGQLYGIDITLVKEINRKIQITVVPDAPDSIIGLMNMRGQIVTVLDLGKQMLGSLEQSHSRPPSTCVILKNNPGELDYIGFVIDRLGNVVESADARYEPTPANLTDKLSRFVREVVKQEHEIILVLEPFAIFNP